MYNILKEGDSIYKVEDTQRKKAILAGIDYNKKDVYSFEEAIDELGELARASNFEVISIVSQRKDKRETGTYFGKGKLEELKEEVYRKGADLVIFDDELSGMQIRNLEEFLGIDILDRTGLILGIFGQRAKTKEGKLQVELAQLEYEKPRLIGLGQVLSRTGAGIGTRGLGESKLELDRRVIDKRIVEIKKQLAEVKRNREVQRKERVKSKLQNVALVGYTNAGKSTIMNKFMELADSQIERAFVKDMLFATLDPFNKKIELEDNLKFILTDTVGFVSKLPHSLVEAFMSTLEEVLLADYLVFVVDISNDNYEYQLEVTLDVIKELGGQDIPFMIAYNKIDKLSEEEIEKRGDITYDFVDISAMTGEGFDELIAKIKKHIYKDSIMVEMEIPYDKGSISSYMMEHNKIEKQEYTEKGVYLKVMVSKVEAEKYKEYIIND